MSDHKDKIPFGGRDWNKDGKYDNFDRMTDFYVYKKVTEDWEKNGAWDKPKKPQNHYPDTEKTEEENFFENCIAVFGILVIIGFIWWAIDTGTLLAWICIIGILALLSFLF